MRASALFWRCITLAQFLDIRCVSLLTTIQYFSMLTSPDNSGLDTHSAYQPMSSGKTLHLSANVDVHFESLSSDIFLDNTGVGYSWLPHVLSGYVVPAIGIRIEALRCSWLRTNNPTFLFSNKQNICKQDSCHLCSNKELNALLELISNVTECHRSPFSQTPGNF
ncbi:hypothetical protein BD769DRAFT_989788 [Suillus cothurnatus]|nr:hypothetical protein BD769DRAFT_989788 [Suillus cothurnatus]